MSLRESIQYLTNTLKRFPEELIRELVEDLVDLLLDALDVPAIQTLLEGKLLQLPKKPLLIGDRNGKS